MKTVVKFLVVAITLVGLAFFVVRPMIFKATATPETEIEEA